MIDDVHKLVPWMEETFQKGFKAVDCYRKRSKLAADFLAYQEEVGGKSYSLVKARLERLASKFAMARRLLKVKVAIRQHVRKSRFKRTFKRSGKDLELRNAIAQTLKDKTWWKKVRLTVKVLCPIMKSLRLCDARIQGKAGLLWPSLVRLQESVGKRLSTACEKVMPSARARVVVQAVKDKLAERAKELESDEVKAACLAHPRNQLKMREETDEHGPFHKMMKKCRSSFFKVIKDHPLAAKVQNCAVEYFDQKGPWLDGTLVAKCTNLSLEAFWEEVGHTVHNEDIKELMVDVLSHVVDSADSERLWCLFQASDPKGSKRSRLSMSTKEKEVGIVANIKLKRFVRQPAKKRRLLGKQNSDARPQDQYAIADECSENELQEPAPATDRQLGDGDGSSDSDEDIGSAEDEGGEGEDHGHASASSEAAATSSGSD
jgi:hypothetical protein